MKQRYGGVYRKLLEEFRGQTYNNYSHESRNQISALKEFLENVSESSEYYKEKYAGIDLTQINSVEDLEQLPILEKEELRQNVDAICTLPPGSGIEAFTGGTTGKSLRVKFTKDDIQARAAYLDAFKLRTGVDPRIARKATFSGRSIVSGLWPSSRRCYWRDNWPYRQRLYSTFHLNSGTAETYCNNLDQFKPEIINGFVSAIYDLSLYMIDSGRKLERAPDAIFTTSETLLPFHREAIEKAFDAKLYNQYASAEGAPFVTECSKGRLHYNMDTGVIEFLNSGEILVTSFTTQAVPLIRYRIGDRMRLSEESCICGSCHPVVSAIEGRSVDYLYTPEGRKVSLSHLADVIKGIPGSVRRLQFHQESLGRISILIEVDERMFSDSDKALIKMAMAYRFGEATDISLDVVESIPRTAGGKRPLVVSSMSNGS